MEMTMKANDVMTPFVISVTPDATVTDAAQIMLETGVSGLPVINSGGKLVGMLTEGDLLRRAETGTEHERPRWLEYILGPGKAAQEFVRVHGRKVAEVMTDDPVSVTRETELEDVVKLMERRRLKRVPVIQGNEVVGIISRANLVAALVTAAKHAPAVAAADGRIRDEIFSEMKKTTWAPIATVSVSVENGVVTLSGAVFDENTRRALVVLAENVPGVKSVQDEMVWIEPSSGFAVLAPSFPTAAPAAPVRQ
jgi:CBS-domain-containing membrane protein